MARRGDHPRAILSGAPPPDLRREFSAGGVVCRPRDGGWHVLLVARRHPGSRALVWTLPKGHVEAGETPAAAAVREVREETGIRAEVVRPLGEVAYWFVRQDAGRRAARVRKRVRFFLMRPCGGRFADRDHEMDAVRWLPADAAERVMAHANERALVARARRLLAAG